MCLCHRPGGVCDCLIFRYTPLHWACQKGHTHTVQALLAARANVNVVSPEYSGVEALLLALGVFTGLSGVRCGHRLKRFKYQKLLKSQKL